MRMAGSYFIGCSQLITEKILDVGLGFKGFNCDFVIHGVPPVVIPEFLCQKCGTFGVGLVTGVYTVFSDMNSSIPDTLVR